MGRLTVRQSLVELSVGLGVTLALIYGVVRTLDLAFWLGLLVAAPPGWLTMILLDVHFTRRNRWREQDQRDRQLIMERYFGVKRKDADNS